MPIKKQLKIALSQSCTDAFYFSDDETRLIDAEYLLTVNAAKSIQQLNKCFGSPYKIFLEYYTWRFARDCIFPILYLRGSDFETTRSGKIDIVVYKENLSVPECAIEVKGFNPSKAKIIDDLVRNLEYFSFRGNTALSQLQRTYFIALHSYKNTMSDEKEVSNLKRLKKRYLNYISMLIMPNSIHYNVEVFTIRRGLVPEPDDLDICEFGLDGTEDYHFVGVIVTFDK